MIWTSPEYRQWSIGISSGGAQAGQFLAQTHLGLEAEKGPVEKVAGQEKKFSPGGQGQVHQAPQTVKGGRNQRFPQLGMHLGQADEGAVQVQISGVHETPASHMSRKQ